MTTSFPFQTPAPQDWTAEAVHNRAAAETDGRETYRRLHAARNAFTQGVLTADFTVGGKTRSPKVTLSRLDALSGRRTFVSQHEVANKREARALAARVGAKCWNF